MAMPNSVWSGAADHELRAQQGLLRREAGFSVEWEHRFGPNFPVFMSVARDGMQIYLSEHAGDCQVGGLVHFLIPDVDAWHREFMEKGAVVAEAPNDDLGFRNMTVTDPDGNQLRSWSRRKAPSAKPIQPGKHRPAIQSEPVP
jgi:hypothetical protein